MTLAVLGLASGLLRVRGPTLEGARRDDGEELPDGVAKGLGQFERAGALRGPTLHATLGYCGPSGEEPGSTTSMTPLIWRWWSLHQTVQ